MFNQIINTSNMIISDKNLRDRCPCANCSGESDVFGNKYKGPEIEVAFNPTFLMDPLKVLEGEEVFFELTDSLSPGVLKSNTPFLYVLMPMRAH